MDPAVPKVRDTPVCEAWASLLIDQSCNSKQRRAAAIYPQIPKFTPRNKHWVARMCWTIPKPPWHGRGSCLHQAKRCKVGRAVVPSHPAGLPQPVPHPPLPVLFLPASAAATKRADPSGHAACFARRDPHRWLAKEAHRGKASGPQCSLAGSARVQRHSSLD